MAEPAKSDTANAPPAEPSSEAPDLASGLLEDYFEVRVQKGSGSSQKFKPYWLCLAGSTVHCYKTAMDPTPKGSFELRGATLPEHPESGFADGRSRFTMEVKGSDGAALFSMRSANETQAAEWLKAMAEARSAEPQAPPEKQAIAAQKRSLAYRAKKGMGSKFVGSTFGKQSINHVLDDQIKGIVRALRGLAEVYAGKSKAEFLEKSIFKIIFKCYVEWDRKKVSLKQFLEMDKPLRSAFRNIDRLYAIWGWTPTEEQLKAEFGKVAQAFDQAGSILKGLMSPYIRPKNVMLIKEVFEFIGNPDFLIGIWKVREAPGTKDLVFDMLVAMRLYVSQDYSAD